MKKGLGAVAVLAMATANALGGTVSFNGPTDITPGTANVQYTVSVASNAGAAITGYVAVFGSIEGLGLSFAHDANILSTASVPPAAPADQGVYAALFASGKDVGIGANNFAGWASPITVGVLTVDTSALVAGDQRVIQVSPTIESDLFGDPNVFLSSLSTPVGQEALAGSVTINVVPEPATMLLLGIGGLVALRRRLA